MKKCECDEGGTRALVRFQTKSGLLPAHQLQTVNPFAHKGMESQTAWVTRLRWGARIGQASAYNSGFTVISHSGFSSYIWLGVVCRASVRQHTHTRTRTHTPHKPLMGIQEFTAKEIPPFSTTVPCLSPNIIFPNESLNLRALKMGVKMSSGAFRVLCLGREERKLTFLTVMSS